MFEQGADPEAVYFLRTGTIHLERNGFKLSSGLCVAHPGDVIGVSYAISGRPYDMSACVTDECVVEVDPRPVFLDAMIDSSGLHLEVVRMLSLDLGRCYEVLRTMGPKTRSRNRIEETN